MKLAHKTPKTLDQKRKSFCYILMKTINVQIKQRILKATREKGQVTYKGRPVRITPNFSTETLKARRAWTGILLPLNNPTDAILDYYIQQNSQSPQMEKTGYFKTNPSLKYIYS